jgi:Uncharacterized protein conserved in bacteria (DUF2188)
MPRRRKRKRNQQSQTQPPAVRIPKPKRNQFVIPYSDTWLGNRWAVKKEGSNRATATFPTQEAAIEYGRDLAITQRCELVIHDRKGNERERRNYSHPRHAALRHERLMAYYAARRVASQPSLNSLEDNAANN